MVLLNKKEAKIPARAKHVVTAEIVTPAAGGKMTASWSYRLKKHDISTEVHFIQKGSDESKKKIVEKSKRHSVDEDYVTGYFETTEQGTLHISFDNSYSYFTSKDLLYSTDVASSDDMEPEPEGADDALILEGGGRIGENSSNGHAAAFVDVDLAGQQVLENDRKAT